MRPVVMRALCRYARDVVFYFKLALAAKRDALPPPLPWRSRDARWRRALLTIHQLRMGV